ncbi:MAG: hypothetical protein WA705_18575 [Candidatus Ozemobacteraceae bacterium]
MISSHFVSHRVMNRWRSLVGLQPILLLFFLSIFTFPRASFSGQSFILITYDVSGSMVAKSSQSQNVHKRIQQFLGILLGSDCPQGPAQSRGLSSIILQPDESFVVQPDQTIANKGLLANAAGWVILEFGDRIVVKAEGTAQASPFNLAYPTKFADQNTNIGPLYDQVGSYAKRAAISHQRLIWVFVGDDIEELSPHGNGPAGESARQFSQKYWNQPLVDFKFLTNRKYLNREHSITVQVSQVVDVKGSADVSAPSVEALVKRWQVVKDDPYLVRLKKHTECSMKLQVLQRTVKDATVGNGQALQGIEDEISGIAVLLDELESLKKVGDRLTVVASGAEQLDAVVPGIREIKVLRDEIGTCWSEMAISTPVSRENEIERLECKLVALTAAVPTLKEAVRRNLEINELKKRLDGHRAGGSLGTLTSELDVASTEIGSLSIALALPEGVWEQRLSTCRERLARIDNLMDSERVRPWRQQLTPLYDRLEYLKKVDVNGSFSARIDSLQAKVDTLKRDLTKLQMPEFQATLSALGEEVLATEQEMLGGAGGLAVVVIIAVLGVIFFVHLRKRTAPILVMIESVDKIAESRSFRLTSSGSDCSIQFSSKQGTRIFPLETVEKTLIGRDKMGGLYLEIASEKKPLPFNKVFTVKTIKEEVKLTLRQLNEPRSGKKSTVIPRVEKKPLSSSRGDENGL